VQGCVYYSAASTTTYNQAAAGITTISATLPAYPGANISLFNMVFSTGPSSQEICSPVVRVSVATTTTIYLVGQTVFAVSTMSANGYMRWRRIR
jgi:hypothetical protein